MFLQLEQMCSKSINLN